MTYFDRMLKLLPFLEIPALILTPIGIIASSTDKSDSKRATYIKLSIAVVGIALAFIFGVPAVQICVDTVRASTATKVTSTQKKDTTKATPTTTPNTTIKTAAAETVKASTALNGYHEIKYNNGT